MLFNYHLQYIIFMKPKMIPLFLKLLQLLSEYWVLLAPLILQLEELKAGGLANSEAANRNLWGVAWCF